MSSSDKAVQRLRRLGAELIEEAGAYRVTLAGPDFTNDHLQFVAGLGRVKFLDIEDTMISDCGLSNLLPLHKLEHVRINVGQATNVGLRVLQKIGTIREVVVSGREILFAKLVEPSPAVLDSGRGGQRSKGTADKQRGETTDGEALGCLGFLLMLAFPPVLLLFFLLRSSKSSTMTKADQQMAFGLGIVTALVVAGLFFANGGGASRQGSGGAARTNYAPVTRQRGTGDVWVNGYWRDGTYVEPHYRSSPDGVFENNWTTYPNTNPHTGERGTRR